MSHSGLAPWRRTFMLTNERTFGQVGFIKNGGSLDIWIRIDGRPRWFSVSRAELAAFLASDDKETILSAESNGNSEASFEDDVAALRAADASLP